jgi:GT2 family glycosyltransferase
MFGGESSEAIMPSVSVVICTKDRPAELSLCLDSLTRQTRMPTEVIVVDSSIASQEAAVRMFGARVPSGCTVNFLHTAPGLTRQRNIGVQEASASVILFLDDDTILDENYIQGIASVYEQDTEARIGGVGGAIVPDPTLSESWLRSAFRRIFLLPSFGRGRIKRSGYQEFAFSPREFLEVEFLSGCNMSYRREVFEYLRFDERLTGYSLGEDLHFSYAVSRRWRLVLTPHARLEHREAAVGRPVAKDKMEMAVLNHHRFFREQVAANPLDWLCYFWSLLGGLIWTLRHPGEGRLAGVLLGYSVVLATILGLRTADGDGATSPSAQQSADSNNSKALGGA